LGLSKDSRTPTKEIANNLRSTVSIVNYRIKKLINLGVILAYTINVDWSQIGYRWFHLRINLGDYEQKNPIKEHIRKNPHLIRILKGIIHNVDIHCTFLLNNIEQLRNITEDITMNFPNAISNYQFYSTYNLYKHHFMVPKLLKTSGSFNRGKSINNII